MTVTQMHAQLNGYGVNCQGMRKEDMAAKLSKIHDHLAASQSMSQQQQQQHAGAGASGDDGEGPDEDEFFISSQAVGGAVEDPDGGIELLLADEYDAANSHQYSVGDDATAAAACASPEVLHYMIIKFIKENAELYGQVLRYVPLNFPEVNQALLDENIKCSSAELVATLDKEGIAYKMPQKSKEANVRRHTRKPKGRRHRKP